MRAQVHLRDPYCLTKVSNRGDRTDWEAESFQKDRYGKELQKLPEIALSLLLSLLFSTYPTHYLLVFLKSTYGLYRDANNGSVIQLKLFNPSSSQQEINWFNIFPWTCSRPLLHLWAGNLCKFLSLFYSSVYLIFLILAIEQISSPMTKSNDNFCSSQPYIKLWVCVCVFVDSENLKMDRKTALPILFLSLLRSNDLN